MSQTKPPLRKRVRIAFAAGVGTLLIRALASTWRYAVEDVDGLLSLRRARKPVVFVLWHGEMLPCLWRHRREGIVVLVSTHADGEIITRIVERLGFRTVRGSTSRGGARAMLELARELEAGRDIAVTPDGPRGPRHSFAPGALVVAQRTGTSLICGRARASRAWRLGSWDGFVIPKPFARIVIRYSKPQHVERAAARDVELEVPRFEQLMAALAEPLGA